MRKTITFCLLGLLFAGASQAQTVLFSQDFNSSTIISDYVNGSGEANKFTGISSAAGNPISATNNTVRFTKTGSGTGYFSRNANLAVTAPKVVQLEVDFQVLSGSVAGTTQAQLYIGNGFGNTATAPSGSQAHSKVVIDFGVANDFSVKSSTAPTTPSSLYNTKQKLIWIVNNSGSTIAYTAPDGVTTKTLANDKWDLYVGAGTSTPILNDRDGLSGGITNDLQHFYFQFPTGSENSTIELDNILIKDLTSVLPVNLVSFEAKSAVRQNNLVWTTAGERDNSHFEVLQSRNGIDFDLLGTIKGNGTCTDLKTYRFTHLNPSIGQNYYRLKQVDFNGNSTLSDVVTIQSKSALATLSLSQTTDGQLLLAVNSAVETNASYRITDMSGTNIANGTIQLHPGTNSIVVPMQQAKGAYAISVLVNGELISQKFIR